MSDKPLSGPIRSFVDDAQQARLRDAGGLVVDPRRTRPRYFDGRFLAAADLTADQGYVLTRQADLGRAAGAGIARGLEVTSVGGTRVRVRAGLGVTPSGETVVLPADVDVDLMSLRESQLLDGHLGLREGSRTALGRVRAGAFALALRPVSFTANPRRGYPTTVHGDRTVEDHDIVEATALTLVPWPTSHGGGPGLVRRRLAREIFVSQTGQGLPADLVPLAMVYLDGSAVRWIDVDLLRRPLGAEQGDMLGLGTVSLATRAAHVRQLRAHLDDELRAAGNRPLAAADFFDALPPVGQLPASILDRAALTQGFFPAEVDVDVSFIPSDELPTLVEASLLLPAIDLTEGRDALAGLSVLLLVPVPRATFRALLSSLSEVRRPLSSRVRLATTVRSPLLALSRLRLPSVATALAETTPSDTETSAWTTALSNALGALGSDPRLWYVRRRNLNLRPELDGQPVDIDVSLRIRDEDRG